MYNEIYNLFANRPDIKAKRNYIRIRQKEKEKTKANAEFANNMIGYLSILFMFVLTILCVFC
jgi:hypothetical protein